MNLLDKEYVHIGNDKICKELWQEIQTDQTDDSIIKPYGGLWCSDKNDYLICDWLNYVNSEKPEYYEYVSNKPSCIIKFKPTSKLLKIENNNDFINLLQSDFIKNISNNPIEINKYYFTYKVNVLPNYEKISEYYDLIYINPYINNCFKPFSIKTMLSINPNSIEYFIPLNTETNNKEKHTIKEPNNDYYKYLKYIENSFYNINESNYNIYIKKLKQLKKEIIENKNNLYTNLGFNINNISDKALLYTISNNIYAKKYKEKILELKK